MSGALEMFVVYEGATDYLGVVVRRWVIDAEGGATPDDPPIILASSVQGAREALALIRPGLARLAPYPGDDPAIAEIWL